MRSTSPCSRLSATLALWACGLLAILVTGPVAAADGDRARWGAIASRPQAYGYAFDHASRPAAERAALAQCERAGGRRGTCTVRTYFDRSCGALAEGNYGEWGTATAPTREAAAKAAAAVCDAHLPAEPCKVVVSACSQR